MTDEIKAAVSYWKVSTHMPLARHDLYWRLYRKK